MGRASSRSRRIGALVCVGLLGSWRGALGGDAALELVLSSAEIPDLDANPRIEGEPGTNVLFEATAVVRTSGSFDGAQGWAWGLSHARVDLISITAEGTVTAHATRGGMVEEGFVAYERIDPAKNDRRQGVVQAVVLSFLDQITLPRDVPNMVGRQVYRARLEESGRTGVVRFVDGLRGRGQPVTCAVTVNGATSYPTLGSRRIGIRQDPALGETDCSDGLDDDGDGFADCLDGDCGDQDPCRGELEDCTDLRDNDGDALVDCDDPDCAARLPCPGSEVCQNREDDDRDGKVDCLDPDCEWFPMCNVPENCGDGFDNDLDGTTDCLDPECAESAFCKATEWCGNRRDDDRDDLVDCDDPDCAGTPECPVAEDCDDGVDNDLDGMTDCDDPSCRGVGDCPGPELCGDDVDNDRDGLVDCDDPDCARSFWCVDPEVCDDGFDNDEDGATDCADADCINVEPCPGPERCADDRDNDRDGLVDCDDPDCAGSVYCVEPEDCDDGVDNDRDLRTDCDDRDCSGFGDCPGLESCDDGVDDNGDGRVDCDDPDCRDSPACAGGGAGFDLVLHAPGATEEVDRNVVDVDPGDGSVEVTAWAVPFPEPQEVGAQGWSLAIAHDRDALEFDPDGGLPTIEGTDAEAFFSGGFQKTEVARGGGAGAGRTLGLGGGADGDGDGDDEEEGFISAVVLSFTQPLELDPKRAQSLARARYRFRAVGGTAEAGRVRFRDKLQGSGQPVSNLFTIQGRTVAPVHRVPLEIRLVAPAASPFVRGDANGDGKVNLADAVWSINELIRRGPPTPCPRAADFNGDGLHDLSDAMYLIAWEFLSGPAMPPPFPACGPDLRPSALACPVGSVPYCR